MSDQPATPAEPAAPDPTPPAPVPVTSSTSKKKSGVHNPYIWGTGRRKTSVARVRIKPGEGKFRVNKRDVDEFFCLDHQRAAVRKPLEVTQSLKNFDVFVNVRGGGPTGQTGAVVLGLARALLKADAAEYGPPLREANLLTRDPREVERKKYGQRGARRRFQFSKR